MPLLNRQHLYRPHPHHPASSQRRCHAIHHGSLTGMISTVTLTSLLLLSLCSLIGAESLVWSNKQSHWEPEVPQASFACATAYPTNNFTTALKYTYLIPRGLNPVLSIYYHLGLSVYYTSLTGSGTPQPNLPMNWETSTGKWPNPSNGTYQPYPFRAAEFAAFTLNNTFLVFNKGKVYYSSDHPDHIYWNISTATNIPFSEIINYAATTIINTNILLVAAGHHTGKQGGSPFTYMSKDGMGAIWTKQSLTTNTYPVDLNNASLAALNSSYILLSGGSDLDQTHFYNQVYLSTNLGSTWTIITTSPIWSARSQHKMLFDKEGIIYVAFGTSADPNELLNDVYHSLDGGYTYSLLENIGSPGFASIANYCADIVYNGQEKTVTVYTGVVDRSDGQFLGMSQGIVASSMAVSDSEQVSWEPMDSTVPWYPTFAENTRSVSCAYDSVNGSVFIYGGLNYSHAYPSYFTYSYQANLSAPDAEGHFSWTVKQQAANQHKIGSYLVYTQNHTLVSFWQQLADNGVWYSTDYPEHVIWNQSRPDAAPFSTRSMMAYTSIRYTDYIILAAGLMNVFTWGANTQNTWISSDGIGAVWVNRSTGLDSYPDQLSSASMLAFGVHYILLAGGFYYKDQEEDTIMMNSVWLTTDLGRRWTLLCESAAWSAQNRAGTPNWHKLVADYDTNIIYVLGGDWLGDPADSPYNDSHY